jgi:2-dehydro-3-deoxygalactonokinase
LYDLLITGSVLVANHQRKPVRESAINTGLFADGVDLIRVNKDLGLLEALFSTRSRQVLAELDSEDAASYLSGIVIGADVRDTGLPMLQTAAIANNVEPPVQLVGATVLVQLYAQALARSDISVEEFDGDAAVIAGLIAATSHT